MADQDRLRLNIGPFAAARKSVDQFGTNIYMNYLYGVTVEELMLAEKELDTAIVLGTTESEIKELRDKVDFLESVVSLATRNYESIQAPPIEEESFEIE